MKTKYWAAISFLVFSYLLIPLAQAVGKDSVKEEMGSGEFGIYLLDKNVYVDVLKENIQKLKLQKTPIVNIKDIISYSKKTHEMVLIPSAFKRLMGSQELDFPFVVCVGKDRIYAGSVWSDILSASFGGIVILKHTFVSETSKRHFPDQEGHKKWSNENTIHFDLAYPAPKYFVANDLRDDPMIIHALEKAGKLID